MHAFNTAILCNNMTNSILASYKRPLYHKAENNFYEIIKLLMSFSLEAFYSHDQLSGQGTTLIQANGLTNIFS